MTSDTSMDSTANNTANMYEDSYYLAPGDNGNLQLVSTPFDGKHYLNWSMAVKMTLISKNKYCFVSGACIRVDYTVLRWLMLSISPTITYHMMYLRKSMVHIEQNGQPIVRYFGKLKSIWEDLSSLDPLPECECNAPKACTCNVLKKIVDKDNKNRLLDFLMGLDGVYEVVSDQILATIPLLTVNQAFFKIQQIKMQKNVHNKVFDTRENNGHDSEQVCWPSSASDSLQGSYVHSVGNRNGKRGKTPLKCDYCGKKGHTRAYCFKLKAYNRMAAHVEETHYNAEETSLGAENVYEADPKSSGTNNLLSAKPHPVQAAITYHAPFMPSIRNQRERGSYTKVKWDMKLVSL
ncbi:hypothetical protein RND81_05G035400 [Saponaria officinalis]|uniref:Retrotransposon Copia-like N-terminal domain-containing protein n=1 Tax=Saponaria officinalis TaxID=3572 RepID=A0AAW1KV68_SAPOF